jgi:hypothetical protein
LNIRERPRWMRFGFAPILGSSLCTSISDGP